MTKRILILNALALASVAGVAMMAAGNKGTPPAPPSPPAPPAPPAFDFKFDEDLALPAGRAFGATTGEQSELAKKVANVPVGKSWLEAVTVPAEVTDPAERTKQFKATCRTVTNRVSGAIRRHRKTDDGKLKNFAIRTVMDEKLGFGVRVWRTEDEKAA